MKILQIINSLGTGGAEKLLLDTIPLYRKAGIEMDLLLLWDNDFPFVKQLEAMDCCRIYVLEKSENVKDIYKLSHIQKIRKIIRGYDLVHVHLFPALYFTAFANLGTGKKLIFTEHNTSNKRIKNKAFKWMERWVYGRYDRLVSITEEIKEIYDEYLNQKDKTLVIHNGVDLEKIKKALPYAKEDLGLNLSGTDFLLLQVSGFRSQKDQDTLIRALALLPEHVKLLLAGDGERKGELEKLTESLQLEDRVFFLGARMDIPQLLRTVDVVVLSSHYEGLSLASIEGLASGNPFVASDVPGLTEVVEGAGILFPQGDEKELAAIISALMEDKRKREETAARGVKRAEEFSIEKMVNRHIEMYREEMQR